MTNTEPIHQSHGRHSGVRADRRIEVVATDHNVRGKVAIVIISSLVDDAS